MVRKPKYKVRSNCPALLYLVFVTCLFFVCGSVLNSFAQENSNQTAGRVGYVYFLLLLDSVPFKPVNPVPADEAGNQSINTTINWEDGGLATSYDVYFGTNPTPSDLLSTQTTTAYDPGNLLNSTTYYWRIDSKNDAGTTPGDVWQFSTSDSPPPFKPVNPGPADETVDQSTNTTISWENGGLATSYNVYFGTNPTPNELLRNQATTTYDPGLLLNDTTYYWRIDSKNDTGTTTGDVWQFTTD